MAVEEPPYTVSMREDAFEVRDYPPLLAAETTVNGPRDRAANEAFRPLANFIFGANLARQDIAMTAPVTQSAPRSQSIAMTAPVTQSGDDGAWVVRFFMPAEYTLDTLPRPTNPDVRIVTVPPRRVAVIRFSGFRTEAALRRQEEALRATIARHGFSIAADEAPTYAFYDPPWTPAFLRRNEIMITLVPG